MLNLSTSQSVRLIPLEDPVLTCVPVPAAADPLRQQTRDFIAEAVIPLEQQAFVTGIDDELRIVDRAVQLAGGVGVTEEPTIGRIYADIRAFRILDGPSEAHRAAIASRAVARIPQETT